jgi:hypothetical protein
MYVKIHRERKIKSKRAKAKSFEVKGSNNPKYGTEYMHVR